MPSMDDFTKYVQETDFRRNKLYFSPVRLCCFCGNFYTAFCEILTLPACGGVFNHSTKVVRSTLLSFHLISKMRYACIWFPYELVSIIKVMISNTIQNRQTDHCYHTHFYTPKPELLLSSFLSLERCGWP